MLLASQKRQTSRPHPSGSVRFLLVGRFPNPSKCAFGTAARFFQNRFDGRYRASVCFYCVRGLLFLYAKNAIHVGLCGNQLFHFLPTLTMLRVSILLPYMWFLFVGPKLCPLEDLSTYAIRLPSDSTSRWTPLPSANGSCYRVRIFTQMPGLTELPHTLGLGDRGGISFFKLTFLQITDIIGIRSPCLLIWGSLEMLKNVDFTAHSRDLILLIQRKDCL